MRELAAEAVGPPSEIRDGGGAPSLPALLAPLADQDGHAARCSNARRLGWILC